MPWLSPAHVLYLHFGLNLCHEWSGESAESSSYLFTGNLADLPRTADQFEIYCKCMFREATSLKRERTVSSSRFLFSFTTAV
jgi:hypothetical protein